ncbi:glycine receptor subunit alpha-2 isoform X2 [Eurytemora carolleeae]|uniref:glycine receptor subunit alpha-2 isoform X2 n=1 Tax=Eurytemora carolleeae TaxID=1294199 RepID=UPI000C75D89B|nr:glycine receptor subunit alpha-2 isoform X2 [Eurytemora carolleeae]|eukprot:XP_023327976.1 glycine receptor subunit alpha-2-like isoform X2 [Eurytemora affinis]
MALLVTLFLVLVNIFNNVTTNTPKAEGLTAIEAWMLACILFVFAALAEYAALLFHKSKILLETPVVHTQYQIERLRDSDSWTDESPRRRKNNLKMSAIETHAANNSRNGESTDRVEILPLHQTEGITEQQIALQRKHMYTKVDRFFLVTFPLMFIVFNSVYWYTYLQFVS